MIKVHVMSIERARTRQLLCLGALLGAGVPYEQITIQNGRDQKDFPSSEALCEAGAVEHPHFQTILDAGDSHHKSKGYMAQLWGYLDCLQLIANGTDLAMLIQDDYCINPPTYKSQAGASADTTSYPNP